MTLSELQQELYNLNYPITYEVDAATYGVVCQVVFDHKKGNINILIYGDSSLEIIVGEHNGIMFKGVELILRKEPL